MALSFQLLFGLSQTVNVAILVILCVWVVVYDGGLDWSPNYRQQFNWHKIALTLGLVNITAVEVLLFRSVRWLTRAQVKLVHALMSVLVLALVVVGYWAALQPHLAQGRIILSSLHSWVGTFTVALYLLQAVIGCASFLWPKLSLEFRSSYKPLHVFFGQSIFVLGTVSTLLGLFETIKRIKALSGLAVVMNICGMLLVLLDILVVYILTRPEYKREDNAPLLAEEVPSI